VVEQLPNVNSARAFANRHNKNGARVYLAGYANLRDDMMIWGDDMTKSDQRTAADARSRHTVTLQQYKAMQATLHRIRDGGCLFPDPQGLAQNIQEGPETKKVLILQDWVFDHYTKTALIVTQDEKERKPVGKVVKIGLDPHFSFATMLCDVAWARNHGAGTMILPDANAPKTTMQEKVEKAMPGLPSAVLAMMDTPDGTCGRCSAFEAGNCTARGLVVQPKDPGCSIYVGRTE
jgi:hypothetical protein